MSNERGYHHTPIGPKDESNMGQSSQSPKQTKRMSRLRAYVKTCRLLYNQCLEERLRLGRLGLDERKHASERARLIYKMMREGKTTTTTTFDDGAELGQSC